jgi:ABC-type lipoprotein release transport system permease subunit
MNFQIGWRNIWRNPKRTLVILSAVIIGIWSMIFLSAFMRGITDQMVRNGISTLTGHVQVHYKGYRNDPGIENSMTEPSVLEKVFNNTLPPDTLWTSRVRVSAVASNARHSNGVTLLGADPAKEGKISFIGGAVTRGRFLKPDDPHGIVVGQALVEKFETKLGRKLVLMSQDTDREIASRAFRIVGIFQAEMEATEKQFVFVSLSAAQEMLKLEKGISEISMILSSHQEANEVAAALRDVLSADDYEVQTWQDAMPMVTAILRMYDGFVFLWFFVVFIAMGFGIVNTTLMAVYERIREFGLLKALGMKPWWIVRQVLTESFYLLVLGMIIGTGLGALSVLALSGTGIDLSSVAAGAEFAGMSRMIYPVVESKDVVTANLVVFILGIIVSLYPAIKAARFTPVEAMAHT